MRKTFRYCGVILCVLFSLQLIACSLIPASTEVADTSKTTNVFEATTASASDASSVSETESITYATTSSETIVTTTETAGAVATTSESMESTGSSVSGTSGSSETSASSSSSETSASSASTSASETTQLPKDCLAICEKDPQDEKNYIIYNDAFGFAITSLVTVGGLKGVSIPSVDNCLTGKLPEGALFFTLFFDENKNFTLRDQNGNFLVMTTGGELALTNKPVSDRYNFWRMEKANGGWNIINVGDPSGSALQYDAEIFTFTVGKPSKTGAFIFNFYEVG